MVKRLDDVKAGLADEIRRLQGEINCLERILKQLENRSGSTQGVPESNPASPAGEPRAAGKRLRLTAEKAADLSSKIVKAVKAHRQHGAARADVVKYLHRNGYDLGRSYSDAHLNSLTTRLLVGDAPPIRRVGDRSGTRYFEAEAG